MTTEFKSAPPVSSVTKEQTTGRHAGRQLTYIAAARLVPSFCILASHLSFEPVFKNRIPGTLFYVLFNPWGFNAVSFFIVLSGFILTWVSANRPPDRSFRARRLLRILPVHVVTWVVVVSAFAATGPWLGKLASLALVQGWFPDHHIYWSANSPAWTLSTELVLYAVFPAAYRFLTGKSDRFLRILLAGLLAVVTLLPLVLMAFPNGTMLSDGLLPERGHLVAVSEWKYWLVYVFPLTRVLEALCGMVVCLLVQRGRWTKKVLLPAVLLFLAVTVEDMFGPALMNLSALTIIPIVLLIGGLAAKEIAKWNASGAEPDGAAGKVRTVEKPTVRAVTRLSAYGKLTYGIYMYQWAFILVCERYLHPWNNSTIAGAGLVVAFYALCFGVSMLSYRYLETPINRLMKPAIAAYAKKGEPVA